MNCTLYVVNYNFAIHVTCLLTLTAHKYNELKVPFATQKLSYKPNCKTPLFFIVFWTCYMVIFYCLLCMTLGECMV
jgi:hypothetical protein